MTDIETLRTRLSEADTALHALLTGGRPVRVTSGDGRTVEFSTSTAPDLRRYIAELKEQIAAASGRPRRALLISF
ncbi:gpW family protein [Azospirillum sp. A1-3]|uniref:phage head-tail joining protein n=1 Tax=Azospirillum sp. A1-3 TaxID=185874 RepID=UPI0020776EE9|nr:gpW family protein [Azospirillum sp. A1-3]MCM8738297.1 gpW family protein [Azospirillum sp. A1-3]